MQKLIDRSRDIAKTHDALVTLESFIILFAKAAHGTNEFQAIDGIIKSYTEKTREKLLDLRCEELSVALKDCSVDAVTRIHKPLSRDGFYSILKVISSHLSESELDTISMWAINWSLDAKQKAGICLDEYQSMLDVSRYMENR